MKQSLTIFTMILLLASAANAQIVAGAVASSVLTKPVLPGDVHLKASFANNAGTISWQATTQINVSRYELEKSIDGENFTYVTAFAGTQKQYSTTDNNLFAGNTYYRLKIVGEENSFLYSPVELINTKASAKEIKVLATQIEENLFVWVPTNTSISCANISGADGKMQRKAIVTNSTNLAEIEIKKLPAGMYNLSLQTSKGEIIKLKFSKPA